MYEIEVENKNLIITDPCYLDNVLDKNDLTLALMDYWEKFIGGIRGDNYSSKLQKFGFTNNICCSTLYGDWSCTAFHVKIDPREINTVKELDKFDNLKESIDKYHIGKLCADAGMVCVVDADDVKKFNPHFFEWAIFHQHCVTAIPNFTGTIGIHDIDPKYEDMPHYRIRTIYGISSVKKNDNFFIYQTGL